ncbi:uncharacterized protein LOC123313794 [Coccinella septempunctata]|uniref:uncharacterized protein LOC123313794 n=1 Tax=Coccinella septempunctata TaxID=41139 RepID=UPI001D06A510|nr:uncharacterized protein LOC123313794 [Coccinella septempunctata]XP_044754746.1 uncharacterized protein LOC123313794 [Coccinella septempunctata]
MSHKGSQNLLENKDKKIPINGDNTNETAVQNKKKEIKSEAIDESISVMKTRSSKRSSNNKISEDNDSKSQTEDSANEQIDKEENKVEVVDKSDEKQPIEDESKTDELYVSNDTSVEVESSVNSTQNVEDTEQSENFSEKKDEEENNCKEEYLLDSETFMEPLVLQPDEPCPELEFEESSDKESEKHSPVLSRCTTRRSQNRNIPTPNTPRSVYEPEQEKDQIDSDKGSGKPVPGPECSSKIINLNETDRSSTNVSMTVQVGGNDTRTDFSEGESELLQSLRSRGSQSASRYLTSRRSLRSTRNELHSKSLRDSMRRSRLYIPSPLSRESMERAPSVKRKDRSETPEERKKLKTDSSGFLSKLSSPLTNLRNKFYTTPTETSTPKLTSYKDEKNLIDGDFFDQVEMPQELGAPHNKWCEIM